MDKIGSNELYSLISSEGKRIVISDKLFSNQIIVESEAFEEIIFHKCCFEDDLIISIFKNQKIRIEKCVFEKKTTFRSFDLKKSEKSIIDIIKSTFDNILFDTMFLNLVSIADSICDFISFVNINYMEDVLSIRRTKINLGVSFNKSKFSETIWIDGCDITGYVSISNSEFEKIKFSNTVISDYIRIRGGKLNLYFESVYAKGDFSVRDAIISKIDFYSSLFEKDVTIYGSFMKKKEEKKKYIINELNIEATSFLGGMSLTNFDSSIIVYELRQVDIIATSSTKGDVLLQNICIEEIAFSGVNKDAIFILEKCSISKSLNFDQFICYNKIILNNLTFTTDCEVGFLESQLGAASFLSTDFSLCSFITLYSDFSQINYSQVVWPNKRLNFFDMRTKTTVNTLLNVRRKLYSKGSQTDEELIALKNRREFYRQIKSVADRMQDTVQVLEFRRLELDAYEKFLAMSKPVYDLDRLLLFLGRTNDHGQNWIKPVILAVLINFLITALILIGISSDLSISEFSSIRKLFNADNPINFWSLYPQLLNPVHYLDKMATNINVIHPATWWIDYLGRIIIAFLIFQTVSAFRKYIKK